MSSVTPTTSLPQSNYEAIRKTENLSPTASKTSVISESFNTTKSQIITASGEHSFAAEKVVFKDCNVYMGDPRAQPDLGLAETMDPISSASEVKASLRALYTSENFKTIKRLVDPTRSLSISESFIRLAVVLEKDFERAQKEAFDGKKGDSIRDSDFVYLNSHEAIMQPKELIKMGKLFEYSDLDKLNPSRLIAVGAAGVGKSTLCQYIANTWAEHPKKLRDWKNKFDYLFLIRLRDLASYSSIPTLAEVVQKSLRGLSVESIERILSTCGDKILFLLDGYDEVASWLSQNGERNAFFRELLRQPHWILTTRPNYFNESMGSYNCRKLEIIGFTRKDIKKYIDRFFKDSSYPERARLVHQLLSSNARIAALSHIPINLELLCSVWKMKRSASTDSSTMTKLYGEISSFLFERYINEKLGENIQGITLNYLAGNKHYSPLLETMEAVAWKGLMSDTASLIIDRETYDPVISATINSEGMSNDLKGTFYSTLFNELGFFRTVPSFENSEHPHLADYYFMHLTFQEYFAARYFVRKFFPPFVPGEGWREVLNDIKFNPRFNVVVWFIAGLLCERVQKMDSSIDKRKAKDALDAFIKCLISQPRSLLGSHELALAMRCSEELEGVSVPSQQQALEEFLVMLRSLVSGKMGQLRIMSCSTVFQGIRKFYLLDAEQNILQTIQKRGFENATRGICAFQLLAPGIIDFLIKKMKDHQEDSDVRSGAVYSLGQLQLKGETIGKVAEALIEGLMDDDSDVRRKAVQSLGQLHLKGEILGKVTEAIVQGSCDEDRGVRRMAAQSLGQLHLKRKTLKKVSEGLIRRLADEDYNVRRVAAGFLGSIRFEGETLAKVSEALIHGLRDDDNDVRMEAARSLGLLHLKREAIWKVVEALILRLMDETWFVRGAAARSLGLLHLKGETIWKVVEALIHGLGDETPYVRGKAAASISQLHLKGETLPKVVEALILRLGDDDGDLRRESAELLAELQLEGETLEEVSKALIQRIGDKDRDVRRTVVESLGKLQLKGETIRKVGEALIQRLWDKDGDVLIAAARSLGQLQIEGERLAKVSEALIQRMEDKDRDVRRAAVESLGKLQLQGETISQVAEALIRRMEDKDCDVRRTAVGFVGQLQLEGETLEKVAEALIQRLGDKDGDVLIAAARSIGQLQIEGERLAKVSEALIQGLCDEDRDVRRTAAQSLGQLQLEGETLAKVSEALIHRLGDKDLEVLIEVAELLDLIQLEGEALGEVSKVLIQRVEDKDLNVRMIAVQSLSQLQLEGETREKVAEALIQRLGDESSGVRKTAVWSIGQFQLSYQPHIRGEALAKVSKALIEGLRDEDRLIRLQVLTFFQAIIDIGKICSQMGSNEENAIKAIAYKIFFSETLCYYHEGCFYYYDQGRLSEPLKMNEDDYRKLERFLQTELLAIGESNSSGEGSGMD